MVIEAFLWLLKLFQGINFFLVDWDFLFRVGEADILPGA